MLFDVISNHSLFPVHERHWPQLDYRPKRGVLFPDDTLILVIKVVIMLGRSDGRLLVIRGWLSHRPEAKLYEAYLRKI